MTRHRLLVAFPLLMGILGLTFGCGGKSQTPARVHGYIKYKGQTVKAGTVKFHSKDAGVYSGGIREDGTYEISDLPMGDMVVSIETESANPNMKSPTYVGARGPGMKAGGAGKGKGEAAQGEMMKAFGQMAPPPDAQAKKENYVKIPPQYSDPNKSGLRVTLVAGRQEKNFDLAD